MDSHVKEQNQSKSTDIPTCLRDSRIFLATPNTATGTSHLPSHIPRFGSRRPSNAKSFDDDADAFAPSTVTDILRFGAQINVTYRVDFQVPFHCVELSRTTFFWMQSVLPLKQKKNIELEN